MLMIVTNSIVNSCVRCVIKYHRASLQLFLSTEPNMKKMRIAGAALLAVCCAVSTVNASGIVATYDPVTQKVTMVDSTNGAVLISPLSAMKVYDTFASAARERALKVILKKD